MDASSPIPLADIRRAATTIAGEAVRTPVAHSPQLDALIDGTVWCKIESHQRAGSFKFRGAFNRLSAIPDEDRDRGVVAVSSGNHGAAVSCAAQLLGIEATIFVPEDAPSAKRRLIEHFGAELRTFPRSIADRDAPALELVARTGATFVHPFEDRAVMTGQGTAALELHDQVGPLDALVVPMSGGGLMAGCASAMHALQPSCVLVGVEPELGDDTRRSFDRGERVRLDSVHTIADGLAVTSPGANTFPINQRLVREVLTVSEAEIVGAMGRIFDALDLVVEPSGAVAIAALARYADTFRNQHVGVILSGGNIDAARFEELTGRRGPSG